MSCIVPVQPNLCFLSHRFVRKHKSVFQWETEGFANTRFTHITDEVTVSGFTANSDNQTFPHKVFIPLHNLSIIPVKLSLSTKDGNHLKGLWFDVGLC